METTPADRRPAALRVLRGNPTAEEIAALTLAVLAGPAAGPAAGPGPARPKAVPGWLRSGPHRPAGAWRTVPQ
ncbi:acyl-CoA carboxylase epsilon subunit [Streptomyces sp. NPDC001678]|uniref:acyl-CoA carboxylase epsilon subunit n=1 Tax=Streptomyces sp. NPDC001678 TaxID=3364599 RepID=UPI003693015F